MSYIIEKLPIFLFIELFLSYLAIHIFVGYMLKYNQKELSLDIKNITLQKSVKIYSILFKWLPMAALIIIILILIR
jgi:hypothetical protein